MKNIKKKFRIVGILVILLSFGFAVLYYFGSMLGEGESGVSESIENSKKEGVFIAQYYLLGDSILLPNNTYIHLGEIWVEQNWTVGSLFDPVKKNSINSYSNYSLYIEIPENQKSRFDDLFSTESGSFVKAGILNSKKRELGNVGVGGKNFLSDEFPQLPNIKEEYTIIMRSDTTEKYKIAMKWTNPKIVRKFYLIKK